MMRRDRFQRARLRSSLGEASRSIATKKIFPLGSSRKRQATFMPTLALNYGLCTLPVTFDLCEPII